MEVGLIAERLSNLFFGSWRKTRYFCITKSQTSIKYKKQDKL